MAIKEGDRVYILLSHQWYGGRVGLYAYRLGAAWVVDLPDGYKASCDLRDLAQLPTVKE